MTATWVDVMMTAPVAFLVGLLAGFVVADRYRITRRDDEES